LLGGDINESFVHAWFDDSVASSGLIQWLGPRFQNRSR
jgi:hypothetical protein